MQISFFTTYYQKEIPLAMVTELLFFIAFITVTMFCFSLSEENYFFYIQPQKKSMGQSKDISKNGKDQKTLISVSLLFLAALTKLLFLKGRLGTRLCLQPTLRFSPGFLRS